ASIVTGLATVRRSRLGNGEQGGKRHCEALERSFVWQCDSESRAALLVALQTLVETSFELACLLLCAVRWLTLRNHFAEECECGSDELASSLSHRRAWGEPLCLLLLAVLFRLVYRGVCPRAEQHLEALLQLFDAGCKCDLPHIRFHIQRGESQV